MSKIPVSEMVSFSDQISSDFKKFILKSLNDTAGSFHLSTIRKTEFNYDDSKRVT